MLPKTIVHRFTHYPPLNLAVIHINLGGATRVTAGELQILRTSWFESIEPLFKHIEQPEQVRILLSAFEGTPVAPTTAFAQSTYLPVLSPITSAGLWRFIDDIAELFPGIFAELDQTITDTSGKDPGSKRRNKWIRKRLRKDLKSCETSLTAMRDTLILKIVECEENERDQRLLVLDYILRNVLEDGRKSVKNLVKRLS